jgi:hypothetical protein
MERNCSQHGYRRNRPVPAHHLFAFALDNRDPDSHPRGVHGGTNSSLHPEARSQAPDISAFIYALNRLPACMPDVHSVLLGQSEGVFREHGYANIESWQPVTARARRRRCYFDGKSSLACFIASRSDIDDVVPNLTAYQLEWNKFHTLLQRCPPTLLRRADEDAACFAELADYAAMSVEDLRRLQAWWATVLRTCSNAWHKNAATSTCAAGRLAY